jgi:hypothetical protein
MQLALCRAQARGGKQAKAAREGGREGKAQAIEARVQKGKPLTQKARKEEAKTKRAELEMRRIRSVPAAKAYVRAAHEEQRAANAAAAKAKPVHVLERESSRERSTRKSLESTKAEISRIEKDRDESKPFYEKLKKERKDLVDKMWNGGSKSVRTRAENKLKEMDKIDSDYDRHKMNVEAADARLEHQRKRLTEGEKELESVRGEGRVEYHYAALQAKNPDLIPPGSIVERIKANKVGEAKAEAIKIVAEKHERRDIELASRRGEITKENRGLTDRFSRNESRILDSNTSEPERIALRAEQQKLADTIDTNTSRIQSINRSQEELKDRQRRDAEEVLAVDRGHEFRHREITAGEDRFNPAMGPLSETTRVNVVEGQRFLGRITRRADDDGSPMTVAIGEEPGVRAFSAGLKIGLDRGEKSDVVVHEYGHEIEGAFRTGGIYVSEHSRAFLDHRVGNETSVSLREKFGGNYDPHEEGRKDRFDSAFTEHEAYYVGNRSGSEILSMGAQKLYNDPVGFAKNDLEYFKFTVGILDGSLR